MLAGELYDAGDAELQAELAACMAWLARVNARPGPIAPGLLNERMMAAADAVLRAPFLCDYGFNIRMGARSFVNFGCVFLDVMPIIIGEGAQIGPHVQLCAADHPRDAALRKKGLEMGRPVVIGPNAWIGAGAVILPGVTVSEDAVVGAGSIVTRDVPAGATVMGNPARIRHNRA